MTAALLTLCLIINAINAVLAYRMWRNPPWRRFYPPGLRPEVAMIVGRSRLLEMEDK